MEAIEFLKEYKRMCSSSDDYCSGCPLKEETCLSIGIRVKSSSQFLKIACAVEQWSKEHPLVTNEMKVREVFGDMAVEAMLSVHPSDIDNWLKKPYEEKKQ